MASVLMYIVIALVLLGAVISLYRLRQGGPGPAVQGWVPRRLRGRMNSAYRRAGWQEPYDDQGNRRSAF
jgi:hypothetical protein